MFPGFQRVCEEAAERWAVPALAAGVAAGGNGRPDVVAVGCEPGTRFLVASVTKPFTATLASSLLALDGAVGVWDGVRVADALAHVSGRDKEHGDLARFGDGDDALDRLAAELPDVREWLPPRELWSYANTGYWLVGWLCAQAAGRTYEDALETHVLREAGLEATAFDVPDVDGSGPRADLRAFPRARRPSGGLVSNVADLLRFGEWQLRQPRTDALRVVAAKPVAGVYGLGFFGERVGGVDVWGHGGSYGGFQSSFLLVPSRGVVFAALTNSGRGAQALREIEDELFDALLGARRRVPETVTLDDSELDAFTGMYRNSEYEARVVRSGNGLQISLVEGEESGESWSRPIGPRTFEFTDGDLARYRFDFPRPGFTRIGSRLAVRDE